MRHFAVTGLLLALLFVPAAAAKTPTRIDAGRGISAVLPAGWRLLHRQVTECSDPAQRVVATDAAGTVRPGAHAPTRAAVVLVMETSLGGRFPARPARFRLPHLASNIGGCCEMPNGPGIELLFRDHGREFYAFVYLGRRSKDRSAVLQLLNSLRISPSS
jgi:hypothetical protein